MTSKTLRSVVADANVLLSALTGGASRRVFERLRVFRIVTTDVAAEEIREHLPGLAAKYGLDSDYLLELFEVLPIEIVPEAGYKSRLSEARKYLAKRDPDDVHVLALALKRELPIWSNDGDFDDTPVTVYPTAMLLKVLGFPSTRPR